MSAKARYRLANILGVWLPTGSFAVMAIGGVASAPLSDAGATVLVLGFFAVILMIGVGWLCTVYAFATVRCGACEQRFFDKVFLTFPVQGGCRRCAESIDHAYTVKLAQLFSIGK